MQRLYFHLVPTSTKARKTCCYLGKHINSRCPVTAGEQEALLRYSPASLNYFVVPWFLNESAVVLISISTGVSCLFTDHNLCFAALILGRTWSFVLYMELNWVKYTTQSKNHSNKIISTPSTCVSRFPPFLLFEVTSSQPSTRRLESSK